MKLFRATAWAYWVGFIALLFGLFALYYGNRADGWKGIIFGLAIVTLRDVAGKILRKIEDNNKALNHLRASIESLIEEFKNRSRR